MSRNKYISAGMQFALYFAGGRARKLLKRHLQYKVKQPPFGMFRKPELQTSVRSADRMRILAGINKADIKTHRRSQPKKQKLRTKIIARLVKYVLQETRYS